MFADENFIKLSRKFVCLRLETYESKETQERVRKYLNGKLANTTFVVLSPDGEKELSRASRSPSMSFSSMRADEDTRLREVLESMEAIAAKYPEKGNQRDAEVPDFYSFKQALNVSSADQRLLVFTVSPEKGRDAERSCMKLLANDPELRGKFHYDMAESNDAEWGSAVSNVTARTGTFVIYPGEFGLQGKALVHFPLGTKATEMQERLLRLNNYYAANEKPKHYGQHSVRGRELGINFSNNIEHGVDKDKDGEIDAKKRSSKRR